ncbi:hypothetical protein N9H70_11010, partial [Pseudomonadales bacterium]|nr:hypothetical protein [Pseudomonadales bacterium]
MTNIFTEKAVFPTDPAAQIVKTVTLALGLIVKPLEIRYVSDTTSGISFVTAAKLFLKLFDKDSGDRKALARLGRSKSLYAETIVSEELLLEDAKSIGLWIRKNLTAKNKNSKIVATYFSGMPVGINGKCKNWDKNIRLARALNDGDIGVFFMPSFHYCFKKHSLEADLEKIGIKVQAVLETPLSSHGPKNT